MIQFDDNTSKAKKADAARAVNDWKKILADKDNEIGIEPFSPESSFWEIFDNFVGDTDALYDEVNNEGLMSLADIDAMTSYANVMAAHLQSLNIAGTMKFGVSSSLEAMMGSTYNEDQPLLRERYDNFKEEFAKLKEAMILDAADENASTTRNTIDGGHSVSGSTTVTQAWSSTVDFNFELNSEWGTWAKKELAGADSESKSVVTSSMIINQVNTDSKLESTQHEWIIDDPDIGDHYLIDIKEDKKYGSPMFQVLSGQSLCHHEENTVAREGVEIIVTNGKERIDLNPFEPAVYIVKLRHTGYDAIHPWYNVRLMRSEMKGLTGLVTLGGHPLTNFIQFTNLDKDQWVTVELVVYRSYSEYFFKDLTLEMYSQCEDEFSRNQMPIEIIHDTVSVSATWLQPCADAEIMPDVDFVPIKSSSVSPFPIEIFNPSHQVNPWYGIDGLEMKLVWKVWTPDDSASKQYAKLNDEYIVKDQQVFEEERSSKTTMEWDVDAFKDGKYTVQVELQCPGRSPEYTEPKVVYLQREELQVAGYPQPSDGSTYGFDKDVVVRFNRELNCFNPNMSIDVELLTNSLISVPMHLLCQGNTIIAMPKIATDLYRIAGKDLRILIRNVMDFAGNYLNSEDGVSTYNGIAWTVTAQDAENISSLPAQLSLCIHEDVVIDASPEQLNASKVAMKKTIHETFNYLDGIHKCRLSVSDPY